jgi:hypothetical protein
MNWIDDFIADDIFCETCDSTGINENTEFRDTCLHCHDARECQGDNVNFPDDPNLNADQSRNRWDTD